jgi:hypothetical protein
MFYLFKLIYINEFALSQTNISHTTSSKHNQHFIQPTNGQQSYGYKEGGDIILGTMVCRY